MDFTDVIRRISSRRRGDNVTRSVSRETENVSRFDVVVLKDFDEGNRTPFETWGVVAKPKSETAASGFAGVRLSGNDMCIRGFAVVHFDECESKMMYVCMTVRVMCTFVSMGHVLLVDPFEEGDSNGGAKGFKIRRSPVDPFHTGAVRVGE